MVMDWIKRWGVIIVPGIVGLVILLYAVWQVVKPQEPIVEIIKGTDNTNELGKIFVDVAGEVQKPGVYKLPSGGRVGDALVAAGGLAAGADREWVAKNMNLAEEVKDGRKIYIPEKSDNQNTQSTSKSDLSENQTNGLININTASQAELEKLSGIGEARAKVIISNRPYGAKEELISKTKLPQSIYDKILEQITVY